MQTQQTAAPGGRAWVTGASSGIGAATAHALARLGYEVVLTARRAERIERLADALAAAGGRVRVAPLDVADRAAGTALGAELEAAGGVDVLVNNAGVMHLSPMVKGRVDEWERIIDVNLKGVLYCIHAVLPGMARRGRGHIVNISSVAATVTFPSSAVYCASKAGVRALSDTLRKEGIRLGVRVTDIQPGAVATELPDSVCYDKVREAITAPGSLYGPDMEILQPEDVADAVVWAVTRPAHVDIGEILIRPRVQEA